MIIKKDGEIVSFSIPSKSIKLLESRIQAD